jgi:hypothetical protein
MPQAACRRGTQNVSGKTDEANDLLKHVEAAVSGAKKRGRNPVEAAKVSFSKVRVTKLRKVTTENGGGRPRLRRRPAPASSEGRK